MNTLEALISCLYVEFARGPLAESDKAHVIILRLFEVMKEKHPREMADAFDLGLRCGPPSATDPLIAAAIDKMLDNIEID